MTFLVREEILEAMQADLAEALVVMPLLSDQQVGPGSVDLRLGTEFLQTRRDTESVIDPFRDLGPDVSVRPRETRAVVPLGGEFVLHPGQLVLGCTLEYLRLPRTLLGQVLSWSSWGRLGLLVATAVVVQPGFRGVLTLELVNTGNAPIVLRPGVRVAQLCLWRSGKATQEGYRRAVFRVAQCQRGPDRGEGRPPGVGLRRA